MKGKGILKKASLKLINASPTILTCAATIGVVATAVLAVKATPKATELLERAKDKKGEELTKLETVQTVIIPYIPAIIICAATVSCIFGANVLNKHRQASLASAYAMLDQSYRRYKNAANTVYGEDADSKIKAEAAKDVYVSASGNVIYSPDLGNVGERILFYDDYSGRYFTSTMAAVINAQYHINRNLNLRGEVWINEFYEFLGIDEVEGGNAVGWDIERLFEYGFTWLDFNNHHTVMDDGMECYIISALCEPSVCDNERW